MYLKVVNEKCDGTYELIKFSPTKKYSDLISLIIDDSIILRPLESTDEEGNELWQKDLVTFEYKNKTYTGTLEYDICLWIIECENLIEGFIELREFIESDGSSTWIHVKKIGNKYSFHESSITKD